MTDILMPAASVAVSALIAVIIWSTLKMTKSFDTLSASVDDLTAVAAKVVTALQNPPAAGTPDSALGGLNTKVQAAVSSMRAELDALKPPVPFEITPMPTPTAGTDYVFSMGSSGGADPVSYSIDNLSAGSSLVGGVFAWPAPPSGTYDFTVTATDANGKTATLAVAWTF